MKINRLAIVVACLLSVLYGFAGNESNKKKTTLAASDSAEVVRLLAESFRQSLLADSKALSVDASAFMEGKEQGVEPGFAAKIKKMADAGVWQRLVWKAWREANATMSDDKLPSLRNLSDSITASWLLPATLEPNAKMNYYWGSKGSKPADGLYPMYLYLHGSGPRDLEWMYSRRWAMIFNDSPSVYFIPQIPNTGQYYRWWQRAKQFAWEKLLRQTLSSGLVDANHVYVFGISEGGYGSQRLASFYADYWAAAGPMAGGEPLRNAPPENCANIGFSLLSGELDYGFYRNRLTMRTAEAFDSLQRVDNVAGQTGDSLFRHRVELVPKHGHSIDYRVTTPWLKTFTRNPYPKKVMWEDFEMDGRYRRGFYNLCVEKRPDNGRQTEDSIRTYYVMDIDGNNIRLTVSNTEYTVTEKDPQWGIELNVKKHYTKATGGRLRIYLNDKLVDLKQKVNVYVNDKKVFSGKLKPSLDDMTSSCKLWFDPYRVYPTSVTVNY